MSLCQMGVLFWVRPKWVLGSCSVIPRNFPSHELPVAGESTKLVSQISGFHFLFTIRPLSRSHSNSQELQQCFRMLLKDSRPNPEIAAPRLGIGLARPTPRMRHFCAWLKKGTPSIYDIHLVVAKYVYSYHHAKAGPPAEKVPPPPELVACLLVCSEPLLKRGIVAHFGGRLATGSRLFKRCWPKPSPPRLLVGRFLFFLGFPFKATTKKGFPCFSGATGRVIHAERVITCLKGDSGRAIPV